MPRDPVSNRHLYAMLVVIWIYTLLLAMSALTRSAGPVESPYSVPALGVVLAVLTVLDVRVLRRHGVEWGWTRWLFYTGIIVFPVTAALYYWRRHERLKHPRGRRR